MVEIDCGVDCHIHIVGGKPGYWGVGAHDTARKNAKTGDGNFHVSLTKNFFEGG
jgi:hypothetical protein